MEPNADLLRLDDVSRSFDHGRIRALDHVRLALEEGETLSVVGRSGSGKSTLLSTMVGLAPPDSGTVLFRGREIDDQETWAQIRAAEIGIVFQAFHLIPTLTALENVEVAMFPGRVAARQRSKKAFDLRGAVGLGERAGHLPSELSGGERQRIAIARSLANDPSLIVADEPTGNLDSETAEEIVELLLRLHAERGTALVVATHDAPIVRHMQRHCVIDDGMVEEVGDVAPSFDVRA